MSPLRSENNHMRAKGQVLRWRRGLRARLARPQQLWLDGRAQLQGASLADWAAAHAGTALELVVSEQLLAHLLSEPGLPLADDAAVAAYARQLFGHYFGAPAQRWAIAGWAAAGAKGASALQGLDWPAAQASLAAQQVRVLSLRPAWAAVLQALAAQQPQWLRAPQAALAWVEGSLLTWAELREGRCQVLRHQRLEAATLAALGEALAELRREGMEVLLCGYGLEAATPLAWPGVRLLGRLDGQAPAAELLARPAQPWAAAPRPDFIAQAQARSPLAWPLAATGALVLAAAGWSAWDGHQAMQQAQTRLASLKLQLQQQQRGAPVAAAAARATPTRTDPLEQERQRSLAEVQRLLAQPWGHLLANVEQAGLTGAPGAIHWLGLDFNMGRLELRLEGLASDKAVALQLVDRLSAAPGWGEVVLGRFQNGGEGLSGQRFELVAKLKPQALQASLPVKEKQP
ncbi:hypothetical protein [Paucibacter soli]|uniref:hypothetical protein n=1 Tax=Paucibacter soli TaxID=3133433 RepID=UPI003099C969